MADSCAATGPRACVRYGHTGARDCVAWQEAKVWFSYHTSTLSHLSVGLSQG